MNNWKEWLVGGAGAGSGFALAVAVIMGLIHGSIWYSEVNSDRANLKETVTRLESKIDKVLLILGNRTADLQ